MLELKLKQMEKILCNFNEISVNELKKFKLIFNTMSDLINLSLNEK